MPIKKAAKKALRKAQKNKQINQAIRKNLEYLERKFKKSILEKNKKEAEKLFLLLQKSLDKAAKKGVIKKNTASRKKSQLAKKLNPLLKE